MNSDLKDTLEIVYSTSDYIHMETKQIDLSPVIYIVIMVTIFAVAI